MSDTNFTRSQGEILRMTIQLEDANCHPIMIADSNQSPYLYFAGIATKSGQTSVPFYFKQHEVESKTYGRGKGRTTENGVWKVYAYIPADEVGTCSISTHDNRADCEAATGTWTVDTAASLLTTATMQAGDWKYEIRVADAADISGLETSKTVLEGKLTIIDGPIDSTSGSSFTFSAPTV